MTSRPSDTVLDVSNDERFVRLADDQVIALPHLEMGDGLDLETLVEAGIGTIRVDAQENYPVADALLQPLILH